MLVPAMAVALLLSGCTSLQYLTAGSDGPPAAAASASPARTPAASPPPERTPAATPDASRLSPSATPTADPEPAPEPSPEPAATPTPTQDPEPELVAGPAIWGVGSSGDDVRELQARLRQIQWLDRDPTGYYGEVTATAVSGFQSKRGFPVVGYVDQRTWDRLVSMTLQPSQDELYPPEPEAEPEPEAVAAPGLDPRCLAGRVICIDKSRSLVRWVVGGQVLLTLDARFGSELTPTREGVFAVQRKVRDEYSRLYDNAPMPLAVYFSGGQAVHYSPDFVANGYNGSSHGCVNTRSWDGMSYLFDATTIGDRVVVYWS
jgi:peptidoglycan hydrolase-like protein with peptidoglycan-binding domain